MIRAALLAAAQMSLPQTTLLAAETPPPGPANVDGVTVTAQRPVAGDLQQGVVAYRPSFFTAIRPASAMDMVTWLPGFVFEDTRDMRGLEGSTGNVLIDGKPPTSKTDTLQTVLKRIPADQVDRVDLIVGGAPRVDMHGRNVIANVILKKRDKPLTVATIASYLDTHGRVSPDGQITYSDRRGGRQTDVSLDISRNIAIFPTYGYGPWVRRDGAGNVIFAAADRFRTDGPSVVGSASHEFPWLGGRLRISGSGRWGQGLTDERDQLTTGPGVYDFFSHGWYGNGEAGLRFERAFGKTTLETQVLERYSGNAGSVDIRRPPQPIGDEIRAHQAETIGRAVLRWRPDDKLTLEGDAEHAFNDGFTHTTATVDGAPIALPDGRVDVTEDRWEGGGALTWKPSGLFSLDAALKAEATRLAAAGDVVVSRELAYLKPRLALSWSPDKDDQLRLRLEREVMQIPFPAFVTVNEYESGQYRNGNPDLRPQQAWTAEAVGERHFWGAGDLTVTARYKALADVLDVKPAFTASGAGYGLIANIGSGRETDLIGNLMVPLKRFGLGDSTVRAVITWQKARIADPVSGRQRNLSGLSELQEELHFAQDLPQWKINWGLNASWQSGGTLYRPFGNESLDSWLGIGVFVERRLPADMTFRVEVQNLPGQAPKNLISVFSGLRDRSPLLYTDDKRLSVGPILYLRLRKTL